MMRFEDMRLVRLLRVLGVDVRRLRELLVVEDVTGILRIDEEENARANAASGKDERIVRVESSRIWESVRDAEFGVLLRECET